MFNTYLMNLASNGIINCTLEDDGVPLYTYNTGYEVKLQVSSKEGTLLSLSEQLITPLLGSISNEHRTEV